MVRFWHGDEPTGMNSNVVKLGLHFSCCDTIHAETPARCAEIWAKQYGLKEGRKGWVECHPHSSAMKTHVRGDYSKRSRRRRGVLSLVEHQWTGRCLSPSCYLIWLTFQVESNPLPCAATNFMTLESGQENLVVYCIEHCWNFEEDEDWWQCGWSSST